MTEPFNLPLHARQLLRVYRSYCGCQCAFLRITQPSSNVCRVEDPDSRSWLEFHIHSNGVPDPEPQRGEFHQQVLP